MNTRCSLLAAAILSTLFLAPASATTTLYKFCADSSDNTTQQDNRLVSTNAGWVINDIGADAKLGDGTYTYAFRLKNTTSVVSPTYTDGMAITKVVVGARATNTERVYHVTPSVGTEQTKTLTATGVREELEFVFDSHTGVTSVTITTPSGSGNSYLYDVTITTLKPLTTPTNLNLDGDVGENGFTVEWDGVTGVQNYSVKLVDPNNVVVSSNDVSTTTASFSGLTSSTTYTVFVVALGDHTTTDDSVAATRAVTTAASSAPTPTLVVANTSWTAGVAGTSAVSATLEGDVACTVASVSMSDGSSATVSGGTLSWTPPAANAASSVTATFTVTHGTDSWPLAQVLSVAATPAPPAPAITLSNATRRSFDALWSVSGGGPVASYKVRAWTGRATPDDATGGASESFSNYVATAAVPDGWTFDHADAYTGSTYAAYPVGFKGVSGSAVSPDFGGILTSLSFRLRSVSAEGEFIVYAAPSGSDDWTAIANYTSEAGTLKTEAKTISLNTADGYSKIKFEFVRTGGSASFGTVVVSGTNWPAADFLEGWGGAKVSVGAATSQTFSNPVAGTANYVEVTAVGPSGLATSSIESVNIPHAPGTTISVK